QYGFRISNTWSWGHDDYRPQARASQSLGFKQEHGTVGAMAIELEHKAYGKRWLLCEGEPELLFTENETNAKKLFGRENRRAYVKDGINDYIVHGNQDAVNPEKSGTKAAALYNLGIAPGASITVRLRFTDQEPNVARMSAPRLVLAREQKTELFGQAFES